MITSKLTSKVGHLKSIASGEHSSASIDLFLECLYDTLWKIAAVDEIVKILEEIGVSEDVATCIISLKALFARRSATACKGDRVQEIFKATTRNSLPF